jgi:hypothetical protein
MLPTGKSGALKPSPYPHFTNTRSNQALSTSSTSEKSVPSAEDTVLDFINIRLSALPREKKRYFLEQCKLACSLAIDFITSNASNEQYLETNSYSKKIVNPNAKQLFQLLISPEIASAYLDYTIDFSRILESIANNLDSEKQPEIVQKEQELPDPSFIEEQEKLAKLRDQKIQEKYRLKLKRAMERQFEPTPDNALKRFVDFIKNFVTTQAVTITGWEKIKFIENCRLATFLAVVEILDLGSILNVVELAEDIGLSLDKKDIKHPLAKELFDGLVSGSIFASRSPEANILSELKKIKSHSKLIKTFNLVLPNSLSNLHFLQEQFIKLDIWYRDFSDHQENLRRIQAKYESYKEEPRYFFKNW